MTKIAVSKEVLGWALARSGNNPAEVERKFPKLNEWRLGTSAPSLRQVENFAKATHTPLGYFFLSQPPNDELPIPHYRTLGDRSPLRPSANLIETVNTMKQRQIWMHEYLVERGESPLEFVGSVSVSKRIQDVAEVIRSTLGLKPNWAELKPTWTDALAELRNSMERAGILVVVNGIVGNSTRRKLDPEEFRGFVLVDSYAPLVFVNGVDSKAAQMFTLAHELVHVWFGKSAAFDLYDMQPADDKTEQRCNQVAAEFLVPESALKSIWSKDDSVAKNLDAIVSKFKVSQIVLARRALDLSLISRKQFFDFYREYMKREKKAIKSSGGDFYASQNLRVGRRFGEIVVRAALAGDLLYRDAYRLTGLYGNTFEEYAKTLGAPR